MRGLNSVIGLLTEQHEMIFPLFATRDAYDNMLVSWKTAVNSNVAITPAHHILYNILRRKPSNLGFTSRSNLRKLQAFQNEPNQQYHRAATRLHKIIARAKEPYIHYSGRSSNYFIEKFLEPFGEFVTPPTLVAIPRQAII